MVAMAILTVIVAAVTAWLVGVWRRGGDVSD